MSEYQYIAFRAIDSPVSQKNLQYMRRQGRSIFAFLAAFCSGMGDRTEDREGMEFAVT